MKTQLSKKKLQGQTYFFLKILSLDSFLLEFNVSEENSECKVIQSTRILSLHLQGTWTMSSSFPSGSSLYSPHLNSGKASHLSSTLWSLVSQKKLFYFNLSNANFSPSHADFKWVITLGFSFFFSYLIQLMLNFYALCLLASFLSKLCLLCYYLMLFFIFSSFIENVKSLFFVLFPNETVCLRSKASLPPSSFQDSEHLLWYHTELSWCSASIFNEDSLCSLVPPHWFLHFS